MSSAIGVRTTLIGAGLLGAAVTAAALLIPGVREIDGPAHRRIVFEPLPVGELPPLPLG